jgi:ribonucleotide reductase alpha subunit
VIRRVITLLNAHFDAETGKYVEGWNDARVAKDADALLSFVIKYREEGYGALAEDPEVVELRADIKKLNDEFALHASETADRLAGLTTRLEALAAKKMAGQG